MDVTKQNLLKEYFKISNDFIKRISESYTFYIMMQKIVQDRLTEKGTSLNSDDLNALYAIKTIIDDRILAIDQI